MTDLEKFIELYESIGIVLIVNHKPNESGYVIRLCGKEAHINQSSEIVTTFHPSFVGYYDFYTEIEFTKDGKFITQGFWE